MFDGLLTAAYVHGLFLSMNHMRISAGLTRQESRDIFAFIGTSKTEDNLLSVHTSCTSNHYNSFISIEKDL